MSALDDVKDAKRALDTANGAFVAAVSAGIKAGLTTAFEDPEIKCVVFGVSTAPYNDENAGQGVYGPFVYEPEYEDDFTRDDAYGLFYDRAGDRPPALHDLAEVLKVADWKYVGEALGVSYYEGEGSGNESAFVARRTDDGYSFTEYDQGY